MVYTSLLQLNFALDIKHILEKVGINLNARKLNIKFITGIHYKIQVPSKRLLTLNMCFVSQFKFSLFD